MTTKDETSFADQEVRHLIQWGKKTPSDPQMSFWMICKVHRTGMIPLVSFCIFPPPLSECCMDQFMRVIWLSIF